MAMESYAMTDIDIIRMVEDEWRDRLTAAVAAERKKWEPVIAGVMREVPWQLKSSKKGNAPGHAHEVVGIWDSDNGELAGTQCAWCKAWNTALNIIEERKQS